MNIPADMSKITKRKHVMKEMQTDDFDAPESNQHIVRILGSRGNNLHEVESAEPIAIDDNNVSDGDDTENAYHFLVSMPTKFRKNVWVKRGDFVIVESIDEGDKVKAEIVRILTPQHIKEFTKMGIWPEKFSTKGNNEHRYHQSSYYANDSNDPTHTDDDDDDDLFVNTNRAHYDVESEVESQDSSDEESDYESADDRKPDDPNDANSGKHQDETRWMDFYYDYVMNFFLIIHLNIP